MCAEIPSVAYNEALILYVLFCCGAKKTFTIAISPGESYFSSGSKDNSDRYFSGIINLYVVAVLERFYMAKIFRVQTPVNVGAKWILPLFSSERLGSVQIPVRFSFTPAPGISFSCIFTTDLYNLYYRGVNYQATIANALDSISPIRGNARKARVGSGPIRK